MSPGPWKTKNRGNLKGILYLENNLSPGAFTARHNRILGLLSAQMVISIENARLYAQLEQKVEERTRELERLAITDELTQLYNRRYFNRIFIREARRAKRLGIDLVFCMLDIDHFKRVNDTFGHSVGDQALMSVGRVLMEAMKRACDYAFRLGGEEFAILTTGLSEQEALAFVEAIRAQIETIELSASTGGPGSRITASFGLMVMAPHGAFDDVDVCYKLADDALYRAKQKGRNRVEMGQR